MTETMTFKLDKAIVFVEEMSFFPMQIVLFRIDQIADAFIKENCPDLTSRVMQLLVSHTDYDPNIVGPSYDVVVRVFIKSDEIREQAALLRLKYGQ